MTKKAKDLFVYVFLGLLIILMIFFRGITLVSGLVNVKSDLLDMLVYKRDYSYGQKIELIWEKEYRLAKLLTNILRNNDKIYFVKNESNYSFSESVLANFVYPIKVFSGTNLNSGVYVIIYPNSDGVLECKDIFILDLDNLKSDNVSCKKYFENASVYSEYFKLIKL